MDRRFLLALVALFFWINGCAANTPIRRSALVPRPNLPANHGAPIGDQGIRVFGHMNSMRLVPVPAPGLDITNLENIAGTEGDAGVWIPTLQFGGGFWGAANENISFGAQINYSNLDLAQRNLVGVLEFPEQHQSESIIMGGVGVRANIPVSDGLLTPAIIAEGNVVSIPQAVFLCDGACQPTSEQPMPTYTFERLDRSTFILPNLALHLTISPIEYLNILVMFGGTRGVRNNGFDPDIANVDNDTLSGYLYGYAGAGLEGRYEFVYATAVLFAPFGQPSEINFGASLTFSVGLVYTFGTTESQDPMKEPLKPQQPPSRTL